MSIVSNKDRYFIVAVDQYEDWCMRGILFHGDREQGILYDSLLELIVNMDFIFDSMNCPRQTFQMRCFPGIKLPSFAARKREEKRRNGRLATFRIYVKYRYHASWQGTITWQEENKTQEFESVRELFCLLEKQLSRGCLEQSSFPASGVSVDFYRAGQIIGSLQGICSNVGAKMSNQTWLLCLKEGRRASFSIRVLFHEHATWQGVIYWREAGVRQQFRSFKEMLFLIASVAEIGEEEEKSVLYGS